MIAASPVLNTSRISPTAAYNGNTLLGYCNATDAEGDYLSYDYKWFTNNILNYSGVSIDNTLCYQETSNISASCGSSSIGSYECIGDWHASLVCANTYDGNWSSYGSPLLNSGLWNATVYINYTKPSNALPTSLWQYKGATISGSCTAGPITNISIPSSCWNQVILQFSAYLQYSSGGGGSLGYVYCYNGSAYQYLADLSIPTGCPRLYEEGIWWNYNGTPQSIEMNVNNISNVESLNNYTFSCRAYDGSSYSSYLNSSTLQVSDCNIPISGSTTLSRNYNCNAVNAFNMSPNSILNCQGHTITGSNPSYNIENGTTYGIYGASGDNYTIKHCNFTGFDYGIGLFYGDVYLDNVSSSGNALLDYSFAGSVNMNFTKKSMLNSLMNMTLFGYSSDPVSVFTLRVNDINSGYDDMWNSINSLFTFTDITIPISKSLAFASTTYITFDIGEYTPSNGTINLVSNAEYLDLTADGTNYGATSEGWTQGETDIKNISSPSTSVNNLLIVRLTKSNGALTYYINDNLVGTTPAYVTGDNSYYQKIFNVTSSKLSSSGQQAIKIIAGSSQNTVYLDYILLASTTNISYAANGTYILVVSEFNTGTSFNTTPLKIYNSTKVNVDSYNMTNIQPNLKGNIFYHYLIPQSKDETYYLECSANVSNGKQIKYSSNYSLILDSILPSILSVTTSLNVLVNTNFDLAYNITETYIDLTTTKVEYQSTNYTLTNRTFQGNSNILNKTISFTSPGTHPVSLFAYDKAGHLSTYAFNIASSEPTLTTSKSTNQSYIYNVTYLNITDSNTKVNKIMKVILSVRGNGSAYINTYNVSYNIENSDKANNMYVVKNNSNLVNFTNLSTSINYLTDAWNNTNSYDVYFNNTLYYTIPDAIEYELENTGTENQRLFYVSSHNTTYSFTDVWVLVPIRTPYDRTNMKLTLKECTAGVNWVAKTCDTWTDITTDLYEESLSTYNGGHYPTYSDLQTNQKSQLMIKVPSLSSRMFLLDSVSGPETTWSSETVQPPGSSGDTAQAGGISTTDSESKSSSLLTVPKSLLVKDAPFYIIVLRFIVEGFINFVASVTHLLQSLSIGWNETSVFFLMLGITIVGIIIVLMSGSSKQQRVKEWNESSLLKL